MKIETRLIQSAIAALKALYGADVSESNIQLQKTRKEFAGHFSLVVFPFLRMSRKSPEQTASEVGEYMKANHFPELMARIERLGGGALEKSLAGASFNYTWTDPQDVVDNIQYIYHTHAKFYHMTEDYKDTAVQIDDAVAAYKRAGYTGFLSSEYEGNNMINDDSLLDSVEQVRRHQEALRRAIEE